MEDNKSKQPVSRQDIPLEPVEIILPDECGDMMWDKVLQQDDKSIYPAGTCERNDLLNGVIVKHEEQIKPTTTTPDERDLT